VVTVAAIKMNTPTTPNNIKLPPCWLSVLGEEFTQPYMKELKAFLASEKANKKIIYPKGDNIFKAFELTPFDSVKVVILGQDPYHGPNQAHGLCFSVQDGMNQPPSLINIFKEIERDLKIPPAKHGCLENWAKQGVLLLNSVLTVQQGMAASHQGKGWERFTDRVIEVLNAQKEHLVFLLWGSYAQKKGQFIDRNKHLVLQSVHPSPLSAHRGFIGNGHFSKTNEYLVKQGKTPIDWRLE
jgi:uracil-DNA glycosylase